ncbi:hypothetical protein [Alkalimarinus coralli]|uniref:hypothetical protein n=1 Tax=Alkalimarinus coralli TaxID=2935863 RepID=UPI00202B1C02|nr:hypothetical protein [Alkalimarinus coralli]
MHNYADWDFNAKIAVCGLGKKLQGRTDYMSEGRETGSLSLPPGVIIRDYRSSDKEMVFELMSGIYDEKSAVESQRRWQWQYEDNPFNPNGVPAIRVVEKDKQIFGLLCGIHQRFYIDGLRCDGVWVTDHMARPMEGVGNARAGKLLALDFCGHYDLLSGQLAPKLNQYWTRLLQRGPIDTAHLPVMVRPLSIEAVLAKKLKLSAFTRGLAKIFDLMLPLYLKNKACNAKGYSFDIVSTFDASFDEIWDRVRDGYCNIGCRNSEYLNWRYKNIPDRSYDCYVARKDGVIKGWIVCRRIYGKDIPKSRIVDMLMANGDVETAHYLITNAVRMQKKQGALIVHALGTENSAIKEAFSLSGFKAHPDENRMPAFIGVNNLEEVDNSLFYKSENWYLTLGDSDIDIFDTV